MTWHAPLIALLASACLPNGDLKSPGPWDPEVLDDGWSIASLSEAGLDAGLVATAYDRFQADDAYLNALALLVVRDDQLVFETYTRGVQDRDRLHHLQSVTKSVTSLTVGALQARGTLTELDAPLDVLWPDAVADHPDKGAITPRMLMTMRSGIEIDNSDFSTDIYVRKPDDPVDYILSQPMYAQPDEQFSYRDCDPHLISALVAEQTGRSLGDHAHELLFDPLSIDAEWQADHVGTSMGGHGLSLRPRGAARLGLLARQQGTWEGEEVVPASWIGAATQEQTETVVAGMSYGFYWWLVPELDAYTAWGHGGSFVMVVPEQALVIVMVSMPDVIDGQVGTLLEDFVPLASLFVDAAD